MCVISFHLVYKKQRFTLYLFKKYFQTKYEQLALEAVEGGGSQMLTVQCLCLCGTSLEDWLIFILKTGDSKSTVTNNFLPYDKALTDTQNTQQLFSGVWMTIPHTQNLQSRAPAPRSPASLPLGLHNTGDV